MNRPKVTILTDPMPWGRELLHEGTRRIARAVRDVLRSNRAYYNHPKYRGHFAVTRSLVEGLQKINASFNYNPRYPWQLADTVIVLAGARTLRQAIRLKQQGRIKKLFAGPNIVVYSSDYDAILAEAEVDVAITPCEWVIDVYLEDNPTLKDRIFSWPAGVDTHYWQPDPAVKRASILIFEKQNKYKGPVGPIAPYADYVRGLGWTVQVIQYGTYAHYQYLQLLQHSCLMLGFVTDESQGLAWAEAWSCDVPTLILKNTSNVYQGRRYACSTAPYLRPQNGLFFDDLEDFKAQFNYWETHREQFTPRAWALENMSDEVCADLLYRHVLGKET
jgi:hypothetical protein